MSEPESSGTQPQDPWEEEIDLRELIRGVGTWWWLWIGLPLVVILAVGLYQFQLPDRHSVQVEQEVSIDVDPQFLEAHDLMLFTPERVRRSLEEGEQDLPGLQVERLESTGNIMLNISLSDVLNQSDALGDELTTNLTLALDRLEEKWTEEFDERQREARLQLEERIERTEGEIQAVSSEMRNWVREVSDILDERSLNDIGLSSFSSKLVSLRSERRTADQELEELNQLEFDGSEFMERSEPSLETELVGPNRARNVILAGVVSLLLTLFGVTFWEIL